MGDDALLVSDLPPLTDEQFARLQETGDLVEFIRETRYDRMRLVTPLLSATSVRSRRPSRPGRDDERGACGAAAPAPPVGIDQTRRS